MSEDREYSVAVRGADRSGFFTRSQVELLKRTIAKDCTDDELALFTMVCQKTGLDPFMRQIYVVKRWDRREKRKVMTIQVGIDGYRIIADRTGRYAGNNDPVYTADRKGNLQAACVTVYKLVGSERYPFAATARWDEYADTDAKGQAQRMWRNMPYLMLGKCAEALALRKAFPAELSGVYTGAEMMQADSPEPMTRPKEPDPPTAFAPATEPAPEPPREPKRNGNGDANEWIGDNETRARFWAYTSTELGLGHDEVHTACQVKTMKDFAGSWEDAIAACRAWIAGKMEAEREVEEEQSELGIS